MSLRRRRRGKELAGAPGRGRLGGLYGTNFDNMRELRWTWSYPTLPCVVVSLVGGMLLLFRRRGWL
jgi:Mg2+ and Co2+ transporter CorA